MKGLASIRAAGHFLALSPMALLVAGVHLGVPWFVFVFFVGILPLVRLLLRDDPAQRGDIDQMSRVEMILLQSVPVVHVLLWALSLPWAMGVVAQMHAVQLVFFALSFWVVTSLNLTIAHELLHRPARWQRLMARLLAGSIGYFQMLEEHRAHHVRAGGADNGDSPETSESVFAYAVRRYAESFRVAQEWERLDQARRGRACWNNRVAWTGLVTLAVIASFGLFAGSRGVVFSCAVMAGTAFTMQAVTYIQHWGLTDRLSPSPAAAGYSW